VTPKVIDEAALKFDIDVEKIQGRPLCFVRTSKLTGDKQTT
jgi:hypothetical protein